MKKLILILISLTFFVSEAISQKVITDTATHIRFETMQANSNFVLGTSMMVSGVILSSINWDIRNGVYPSNQDVRYIGLTLSIVGTLVLVNSQIRYKRVLFLVSAKSAGLKITL